MSYKISTIIPIYNAENDLNTAINSIINQSFGFENIELILVDDASTDGSRTIIEYYQNNFSNVKGIFLDQNSGFPGKPRNIGIKNANAEYIIFLDADDNYLENAFELLYATITKENSDFVMGTHYLNLDNNKVKANLLCTSGKILLNPLFSQENFDKMSYNQFVAPWGKIYRKQFILNNNIYFPEDSLCEDTYFYFKILINSENICILDNVVYNYNTLENKKTAIHGHNLEKFKNFLKGMNYVNDLLNNINLSKNVFLSENISSLLLIFSNLDNNDKKYAIKEIYNFEMNLNENSLIERKEISFLNDIILNKHFTFAIWFSNMYKLLYSNNTIKNFYRRFNNRKMKNN